MDKKELLKKLEILNGRKLSPDLEERKIQELKFHEEYRSKQLGVSNGCLTQEKISWQVFKNVYHQRRKLYSTNRFSSNNYIKKWIDTYSPGKIFLDYACGNGDQVIQAAKVNAELAIGIDLCGTSIRNARKCVAEEGLTGNTYLLQGDCENTGFPDNSIDTIVCFGVLHHLDLSYVFYELRRILKPGGVILALEPLNYNPFIKLYRHITSKMRTEWEKAHILSYKDIRFAERFFTVKNIRHWNLFTICGMYIPFALTFFTRMDNILLRLPLVKMMSWMISFEMHKKDKNSC